MIKRIENDKILSSYATRTIEDEGISAEVSPKLSKDQYIGVKVDDYFNNKKSNEPCPKSVDFVVSVDCSCDTYVLYILEMKSEQAVPEEVNKKFENTISIFLEQDFRDIYCNPSYKYDDIRLYLISKKPKQALRYENYEKYVYVFNRLKEKDGLHKDITLSGKLFKFRNKICQIKKEIPGALVIDK
ncbi:hypothetical protein [Butyrivibrio sp. WCD2001]|uniref:hypothetical protein n=1 Tax=Butyrivibrio sp. WCD2001 TaxID=1280681 RepID=UPI0004219131|nr:hypothetical protein [Butyrivibrio sp. WCD2001]